MHRLIKFQRNRTIRSELLVIDWTDFPGPFLGGDIPTSEGLREFFNRTVELPNLGRTYDHHYISGIGLRCFVSNATGVENRGQMSHFFLLLSVAWLGLVSPGAATDGVIPIFSGKKLTTFLAYHCRHFTFIDLLRWWGVTRTIFTHPTSFVYCSM